MIRRDYILVYFSVIITFLGCKKETIDYNQKANELIQQVISEEPCDCILEIAKESSIKTYLDENPYYDIKEKAFKELNLKTKTELDTIDKQVEKFILDSAFLKERNISIIKRDSPKEKIIELLAKKCPTGILSISKPIFSKDYNTAIIYSSRLLNCVGVYPETYTYENGKWKRK